MLEIKINNEPISKNIVGFLLGAGAAVGGYMMIARKKGKKPDSTSVILYGLAGGIGGAYFQSKMRHDPKKEFQNAPVKDQISGVKVT